MSRMLHVGLIGSTASDWPDGAAAQAIRTAGGLALIGLPAGLIAGTLLAERLQASTHTLFVCRVLHAAVSDRHPMVYSAGKFFDGAALTPLG